MQLAHDGKKRQRLIEATSAIVERLEPRQMLTTASVDVGPLYHAPQPNWKSFSGSGNSSSTTVAITATNQPTLTISGTSLTWNDFSNAHTVNHALNLAYRDGVSRAGDITLSFSNLAAGTYSVILSSADYGTAGSTGSPWSSTYSVRRTDASGSNVTVLSNQHTATRYSVASSDLPALTLTVNTSGTASITLVRSSGTVHLNAIRIDDLITVTDTTAPSPSTPTWATAPYSVKAGVAAVSMVAATVSDASGVEYYFENIDTPSRNSGWVATPSWTDLNLPANTLQQYRFKARDKSSNLNQTGWSTTGSVTTATDNTFAGFTTPEIGDRRPTFDFTSMQAIPAAPAAGVHPRIFITNEERPELLSRLASTTAGQEIMALISAYSRDMAFGIYSATTNPNGYNTAASHANDAWGNDRLNNSGYYNVSAFYQGLVNYVSGGANPLPFKADEVTYDGDARKKLASQMSLAAFECWLYRGSAEYDARATDLAKALANWAELVIGDPSMNPANNMIFGGAHTAEVYDFVYEMMTTAQRNIVRQAIIQITWTQDMNYGFDTEPYATTSNWAVLNDFVPIQLMAVEGEAGAYPASYLREFIRAQYNFLTYGWYDTGAPQEGIGKNYQGLATMPAFARRGYFLHGHENVRAFATEYMPHMMQPFGNAFAEYDDWGGSGRGTAATGDYKFSAEDAVGAKYLFPTNSTIDFAYQNYMGVSGNSNPYASYFWANSIGQKPFGPNGYVNNVLVSALCALDFNNTNLADPNWTSANTAAKAGNETFFEPNRGLVNTVSDFSKNALQVTFSSRQDLGGHTHADRNNFNLSALGRMWAIYRTESSTTGASGNVLSQSKYHNMVLVDDKAQELTAYDVAKQPGKIVYMQDAGAATFTAGDAKYAYDWKWSGHLGGGTPTGPSTIPVTETLNNFRMTKSSEWFYDEPLYDRAFWNGDGDDENYTKEQYNKMQSAFRTVGVVRGTRPYALILDDYQKDNAVHNYKWYMQMPDDLSVSSTVVDLNPSNYRNDVILQEASGNRRLLVRVLQADGLVNPATPATIDSFLDPRYETSTWKRLLIQSNSIAPNFKVLLFPFTNGQALPTTTISAGSITNTVDGRVDTLNYSTGSDGRTRYTLLQNGSTVVSDSGDTAPAAPSDLVARPRSQTWVDLSWTNNSTNEQRIIIERSTDGTNFTPLDSVLAGISQYLDITASAGTTYYYRLKAVNNLASSASNVASTIAWSSGTVFVQPNANTYSQNFNTLISSLVHNMNFGGDSWLPGWYLNRTTDGTITTQFRFTDGDETYPRPFSTGSEVKPNTDRSFGGMPQSNGFQTQGVLFQNRLGSGISQVDVNYVAEQWRRNVNATSLKLYYKVQATIPVFDLGASTTGWTAVPSVEFSAGVGSTAELDGNALANRSAKSTMLNVTVPDGQYLWLGWRVTGGSNTNNAVLSIDDLNVNFISTVMTGATFEYQSNPNQLRFIFNNQPQPPFNAASLTLTPAGGGTPIPATNYAWDGGTNTANFSIPTPLADGNYLATLPGGFSQSFFVLAGDASHNRTVDSIDFGIFAANYGGTGKTFGEGDFNYDTRVNTLDFNLLAGRFGTTLLAGAVLSAPLSSAPAVYAGSGLFSESEFDHDLATDVLS